MSPRKVSHSYQELGGLLKNWRAERFRSALAMCKEGSFSFSYSSYADFERGIALPSPEEVLELAQFFKKDPKPAILLWARVQMPTPELMELFNPVLAPVASAPQSPPRAQGPSFENTWVFGPRELVLLRKFPWIWEICGSLAMSYPEEVPFHQLRILSGISVEDFVGQIFGDWIAAGYVIRSETGLRLGHQHIYLPRTAEWNEIRTSNISRALEQLMEKVTPEMLDQGEAYRELINRPLTLAQVQKWVTELKKLETHFKADSYQADSTREQDSTHTLMMILGPRSLRKGK